MPILVNWNADENGIRDELSTLRTLHMAKLCKVTLQCSFQSQYNFVLLNLLKVKQSSGFVLFSWRRFQRRKWGLWNIYVDHSITWITRRYDFESKWYRSAGWNPVCSMVYVCRLYCAVTVVSYAMKYKVAETICMHKKSKMERKMKLPQDRIALMWSVSSPLKMVNLSQIKPISLLR